MVRRRHGRRRRRQTYPSTMPATLAAMAIYLISLSSPTPGVATTAAVSATPEQPGGHVDVDVGVGEPRRGGGIGGKGQQGPTIDSSWVKRSEKEVVKVSQQGISGQEGGQPRIPDRNADAHLLRPSLSGSGDGGSSSSSSSDGARGDEKTWLQLGHSVDGLGHSSSRDANTPPPVSGEVLVGRDDSAREVEDRSGGGDDACSTSGGGGKKSSGSVGDGGSDNDRWAAQTVSMPAPRPQKPSSQHSASSGASKTIGGTVPDVLEDSAWCVGEGDCVRPQAEGADDDDETQGVPAGQDGSAGSSSKTIGGTVPDVLEDSAWCAREEDCVRPAAGVTRDDDKTDSVAGGLDDRAGSSAASVYGGGAYRGGVDGEAETTSRVSAPAAAVGKESIPRGRDGGVLDDDALERPTSEAAMGFSDKHAGGRTTGAAAAAAAATSAAQIDPNLDGNDVPTEAAAAAAAGVYPYSRPASSKQKSAPTVATTPHDVAADQPSRQERRGPLVKGEGANTNTDTHRRNADSAATVADAGDVGEPAERDVGGADGKDLERRSRGDAGAGAGKGGRSRGRDLTIETAEESGGQEQEEEVLERVTAIDRGRSSWRTFAYVLLVCAVVFGTYLRGTLLSWVPLSAFGRDPREGWAIDLDSAIANARSRASSFCSGRASVFSEDPVDDSDLPELVSDHEGDSGGGGGGGGEDDWGSDGDGEAPLMWDTRPKPDDYLVFHPVLGVVPAGAMRAWGGDGCGGWSGGKAERNGCTVAAVRAVEGEGVNGGHDTEGVTGGRSKEPRCSPRRDVAGGKVAKAVGDGKRKRLPPVRNTDAWFEWVAAGEATAAAAAAAATNVPDEASPVVIVPIEETAVPALIPTDGTGAAPPDKADEVGAGTVAKEVAVGGGAIGSGSEKERSGGGRLRTTTTTKEATKGVAEKHPSSLSHTPAAFSLQFGVGNGTGNTCNGGGGGGGESSTEGGSGRPGGGVDSGSSGCDDSLGFGGGCSSDDGRDVRVDDFSARLSSEQPPAVTAAYHVS